MIPGYTFLDRGSILDGYTWHLGGVSSGVARASLSKLPDRNGSWYQHHLTLFAIFYESDTEGTIPFGLCLYVLRLCNVHVCIVFNLCAQFELVKSPDVTLSG